MSWKSLLVLACVFAAASGAYWRTGAPGELELNDPAFVVADGRLSRDGRPFTGHVFGLHSNGHVSQRGSYVEGRKEGVQERYHFNGRIVERLRYHLDKKEGLQQGWYGEGPRHYEAYYKQGVLDGKYVEWHQNGQVFREQEFNDGLEAAQKIFYENGSTYSNYVVKNERIYGEKSSPLCQDKKKDGER